MAGHLHNSEPVMRWIAPLRRLGFLALISALTSTVLAALPVPAPPQGDSPTGETPGFEEEVSVGYVLVPVVVRSGTGYIENLDKDDFRLLVDGHRVAIDSFERRADAPASIVFLQDLSGSMAGPSLELSREAVSFFLGKAAQGDEFSIASFASDSGRVDVPFTSDQTALRESVGSWKAYGTTALHDAVAWVPSISSEGHNPKRFAVLITDGVDNASRIPPEQARDIVQRAQLPVYVIGLGSGSPYEVTTEGQKIYRYADVLNLLAVTTGGRYYSISKREDLQKALDAIYSDLRHQYVLGFPTGEGRSRQRDLRVEVKAGDRTSLFRRGYKGPPPAGSSSNGG
jgi:VWFA-related protein